MALSRDEISDIARKLAELPMKAASRGPRWVTPPTLRKTSMPIPTAAPSWAETSVQWLAQNNPTMLVGAPAVLPAAARLHRALRKMSFDHPHTRGQECPDKKVFDKELKERSERWHQSDHHAMRDYLAGGGFVDRRLVIDPEPGDEEAADAWKATKDASKTVAIAPAVPDEQKELQDAVEAAALQDDPRFGVW